MVKQDLPLSQFLIFKAQLGRGRSAGKVSLFHLLSSVITVLISSKFVSLFSLRGSIYCPSTSLASSCSGSMPPHSVILCGHRARLSPAFPERAISRVILPYWAGQGACWLSRGPVLRAEKRTVVSDFV